MKSELRVGIDPDNDICLVLPTTSAEDTYLSMKPEQARLLAGNLIKLADECDRRAGGRPMPQPPKKERRTCRTKLYE